MQSKLQKHTLIKTEDLRLSEYNPRTITKKRFDSLKNSIKKDPDFFNVRPCLVNNYKNRKNIIFAGNMRYRAAKELGWKEIPCYVVSIHPKQEKIWALKDNNEWGDYDEQKLAEIMYGLNELDLDLSLTGFDDIEISNLLDNQTLNTSDEKDDIVPDKPKKAISKQGEIYQLGQHKLMCGDATKKEDVDKLLDKKRYNLLFTSPPYNMKSNLYTNYKDNKNNSDFIIFNINVIINYKRYLEKNGYIFWNMSYNKNSSSSFIEIFYNFVKNTGLVFLEDIVWDKGHGMPLSEQLTRQYEHLLVLNDSIENIHFIDHIGVFGNKKIPFDRTKKRGITNYWRIDTYKSQNKNIKAAFPVELPVKAILITTNEKDIVIDCFGGSGTTLIACEKTNRICYMMEIDPIYCDVIRERYKNYVKK